MEGKISFGFIADITSIPHPLPPKEEGEFPLSSGEGVRGRGKSAVETTKEKNIVFH